MTRKERFNQIADALILVARTNHYMVGITEPIREYELSCAVTELISRPNELSDADPDFAILDLALDVAQNRIGMTIID